MQYSCLENPADRGAWWAAVHGVAQSRAWLKQLSMHACIGDGKGNPLQYSCLENPRDGGAWWAAICGVAQSRTWLKWLSSSRNIHWGMPLRAEEEHEWKGGIAGNLPFIFKTIRVLWITNMLQWIFKKIYLHPFLEESTPFKHGETPMELLITTQPCPYWP